MAPRTPTQSSASVTPDAVAQPTTPAMGSGDYSHFVWTQLSEIQKTLGSIGNAQQNLQKTVDKSDENISAKISKIEADVAAIVKTHHTTKWVLIILLSLGGFALSGALWVAKEVWDLSKPLIVQKLTAPPAPVLPLQPQKK